MSTHTRDDGCEGEASAMTLGEGLPHQWERRFNVMAEHIRGLGDDDLIDLVHQVHFMLHVVECFGITDVWALDLGAAELKRRGYTLRLRPMGGIRGFVDGVIVLRGQGAPWREVARRAMKGDIRLRVLEVIPPGAETS